MKRAPEKIRWVRQEKPDAWSTPMPRSPDDPLW